MISALIGYLHAAVSWRVRKIRRLAGCILAFSQKLRCLRGADSRREPKGQAMRAANPAWQAKWRSNLMRATGTVAVASLTALGVSASIASAEPLSMTFTEARANVGDQLSDDALFAAPATAPFSAEIDPGSGSITGGVLQVPEFSTHIETPVSADVTVDFNIGVITGSFTQAVGALTGSGEVGGTLTANGKECIVSTPAPLTLSTAGSSGGTSPRSGAPFTKGLTGPGAIAGEWTDMEAEPINPDDPPDVGVCEAVEEHIEGPGGIWLQQEGDLVPPSAPQLTSTDPASPGSSGNPRILGAAEVGSTVRVYAGSNCTGTPVSTGSAAGLGSPGMAVEVAEGVTASFSATATDAADNTSACSAPISYTRVRVATPEVPTSACVVPRLKGKSLRRARTELKAANCSVGKVHKPRRNRLGPLVVKSSNPAAGQVLEVGSKVNLRVGPKARKTRR